MIHTVSVLYSQLCALCSFAFLCTRKSSLLICRKQKFLCALCQCLQHSLWAESSHFPLEVELTVCTVPLSLLLCRLSPAIGYRSHNPSISNWSTLSVAFPLRFLPYQDLMSKSLKSVKSPSLTAEVLSLCKMIFACALACCAWPGSRGVALLYHSACADCTQSYKHLLLVLMKVLILRPACGRRMHPQSSSSSVL